MNDLPDDVKAEMRRVLEENESFNSPPKNSFTLKDYYDFYINECNAQGISDGLRITIDVCRTKLDNQVEAGRLNKGIYTFNGTRTAFYWRIENK